MPKIIPPEVRDEARALRTAGVPLQRIAKRLSVSVSTVHGWTEDIELTPEQQDRNLRGPCGPQSPEFIARRTAAISASFRAQRLLAQHEGRERARRREPLHQMGCMLYWAEGSKSRNQVQFANSDPAMLLLFRIFMWDCLGIEDETVRLRVNAYTNNGLSIDEIEAFWLRRLNLPRSCVRSHQVNHHPTSSSGRSRKRLLHGVCTLTVNNTAAMQHIYGAIQEYGGFEEPKWLG